MSSPTDNQPQPAETQQPPSQWDPGNSPPEMWSEPLTSAENVEVRELLQERREERAEEDAA